MTNETIKYRAKIITEKILNSAKKSIDTCKKEIESFVKETKKVVSMKNIIEEETYFYFD